MLTIRNQRGEDGNPQSRFVINCSVCGGEGDVSSKSTIPHEGAHRGSKSDREYQERLAVARFGKIGWTVGKKFRKNVCPGCRDASALLSRTAPFQAPPRLVMIHTPGADRMVSKFDDAARAFADAQTQSPAPNDHLFPVLDEPAGHPEHGAPDVPEEQVADLEELPMQQQSLLPPADGPGATPEGDSPSGGRTTRKATNLERMHVIDLLREFLTEPDDEGCIAFRGDWTDKKVADEATRRAKSPNPMSVHSVQSMRMELFGRLRERRQTNPDHSSRIAELERQVADLSARLRKLESEFGI